MLHSKKGVSPLLSLVLVLAITIAIGTLMASWMQSTAQEQAKKSAEAAAAGCSYATINIEEVIYKQSTNELIIKVKASGTQDIDIDRVTIVNSTYSIVTYENGKDISVPTIAAGDITYITLENVPSNVTEINVVPERCRMNSVNVKSDEFTIQ
jgi:flagellin-like protein